MKIRRPFRFFALIFGALTSLYLVAFVCRFEIFSNPVRNTEHGWLGPRLRGDTQSVDIGDVYYYEGADYAPYRFFRPLCKVWLFGMGL